MDENMDLNTKIDRLLEAITGLVQKVDEQQARIDELDSVLYDGLIGPANEAIAQNEYDSALSDFRTKYAEKLGPYEDAAKAIEGDDFDVYKGAFDAYNEGGYDFSPDEYVDKVAAQIESQIASIREAVAEKVGVDPSQVDVDVNASNGEVNIDVDNKTTDAKPEDNVKEAEKVVESSDEGNELEDFEKSLKEEADKDKDVKWIRG